MIIQWEVNKRLARKEREAKVPKEHGLYEFHHNDGTIQTINIPRAGIRSKDGVVTFTSKRINNALNRARQAMVVSNKEGE